MEGAAGNDRPAPRGLLDHVLLAVASGEDAESTCESVLEHLTGQVSRVTVVTVVPSYRKWADSVTSDFRLQNAAQTLRAAERRLAAAEFEVDTIVEHSAKTSEAINALADRIEATAIVFTPRGANRLLDFLAGDTTWSLVKKSTRPVLVMPALD